mmetsp:Transcript_121676/g.344812  ORF Transcript_121676/g.344812 Transcript_121676/m.344812 type:complete len:393 (-) Transcript_121676:130-1308(-)
MAPILWTVLLLAAGPSLAMRGGGQLAPAGADAMRDARAELAQKIQGGGDPLLASQEFSAKAIGVAEGLYAPLALKAGLPEHAILVGGSGGRYEMSTFSDLEYLVVFGPGAEQACEKDKQMMEKLTMTLRKFRFALKKAGLESDAINQPSVRKGSIACSPDKMALGRFLSGDQVTTSMVLEASFLAGNGTVASQVRQAVKRWFNTAKADAFGPAASKIVKKVPRRVREAVKAFKGKRLGDWLRGKLSGWMLNANMEQALKTIRQGLSDFNIKKTLYRPLQMILVLETVEAPSDDPLAFNALKRLEWLRTSGKWPPALVDQVHKALSTTVRARMLAHLDAQQEQDSACFVCADSPDPEYHVPAELQGDIEAAGGVVLCLGTRYLADGKVPKKCR